MKHVLVLLLLASGCAPQWSMDDYVAIHESAATEIPIARQMEELFGPAIHAIEHYGMNSGTKTWRTICFVNQRYELRMEVEVDINFRDRTVTQVGDPQFFMLYVSETRPSGATTNDTTKGVQIDVSDWEQIYAAGGDFSVVGITLETTPAPGIENYIDFYQSNIIPIQLVQDEDTAAETTEDATGEGGTDENEE